MGGRATAWPTAAADRAARRANPPAPAGAARRRHRSRTRVNRGRAPPSCAFTMTTLEHAGWRRNKIWKAHGRTPTTKQAPNRCHVKEVREGLLAAIETPGTPIMLNKVPINVEAAAQSRARRACSSVIPAASAISASEAPLSRAWSICFRCTPKASSSAERICSRDRSSRCR